MNEGTHDDQEHSHAVLGVNTGCNAFFRSDGFCAGHSALSIALVFKGVFSLQ